MNNIKNIPFASRLALGGLLLILCAGFGAFTVARALDHDEHPGHEVAAHDHDAGDADYGADGDDHAAEGVEHDHEGCDHDHGEAEDAHDHGEGEDAHDHGAGEDGHDHAAGEDAHDHAAGEDAHDHGTGEAAHGEVDDGHDHAAHDHAPSVAPSADQIRKFGIEVLPAVAGRLEASIAVPGEIVMNSDRLAHIVPRVSGVVRDVLVGLGERVEDGQVLAVIDSRDLADARADYLAAQQERDLAEVSFGREERLFRESVTAEQDFLAARQAFEGAKLRVQRARQKLLALGVTDHDLHQFAAEKGAAFTTYRITAPFNGTIVAKHIVRGEAVDGRTEIFELADLDTVWVELKVSQKHSSVVKAGQDVTVVPASGDTPAVGLVSYVSPFLDRETRSAMARVVIDNRSGRYRPGLFVEGRIMIANADGQVVLPADSIQLLDDRPCVFVKTDHGFESRPVETGASNGTQIEIVGGVQPGELVVVRHAFRLKTELLKNPDAGCAGHGHAH